jgi:hypothetical protein
MPLPIDRGIYKSLCKLMDAQTVSGCSDGEMVIGKRIGLTANSEIHLNPFDHFHFRHLTFVFFCPRTTGRGRAGGRRQFGVSL